MNRKKLKIIIKQIVRQQFKNEINKFKFKANLKKEYEADELDMIEMLMEIEDELEINIPDKDADKWKTTEDIYLYLCEKMEIEDSIYNYNTDDRFKLMDLGNE